MNQSQPDPHDDVPGTEPEEDDPPLAEEGDEAGPGDGAAPGEPETDGRKYRPL
jgi:hypothetical protein